MNSRTKTTAVLAALFTLIVFLISPSSPISKNFGFTPDSIIPYAVLNGIIISLLTFACWTTSQKGIGDRSIISIIISDLRITRFSSIGIISFLNSVIIGFLLGASAYLLLTGVSTNLLFYQFLRIYGNDWKLIGESVKQLTLGGSLLLLLLVPITRILSEGYVLIFRVAQKYLADKDER